MAGLSTYAQQKLLDHLTGDVAYSIPTTFVGLFTAAPTDAGGGTEVSGGSYARVALASKWSAASGTTKATNATVTFPAASASWGVVTHFGIFDASSAGNLLGWAALTASKTVDSGDTLSFASTALTVTLD